MPVGEHPCLAGSDGLRFWRPGVGGTCAIGGELDDDVGRCHPDPVTVAVGVTIMGTFPALTVPGVVDLGVPEVYEHPGYRFGRGVQLVEHGAEGERRFRDLVAFGVLPP